MPQHRKDTVTNESVWTRPVRGTRGPIPGYSRDNIAVAGIELADREGFEAVTMRAVAQMLGTTAASLYRYVGSREELIDLMVDRALGVPDCEIRGPEWKESALALAAAQLRCQQRHSWLTSASVEVRTLGPNALAWFEAYLAAMEKVAVPTRIKMELIALITGLVSLFAQQSRRADASARAFDLMSVEQHPNLMAAFVGSEGGPTSTDLFDRAVIALCAGLAGDVG